MSIKLITDMETVLAENIKLKQENIELKERLKLQENWTGIREGYLVPMFIKRYGEGRCIQSNVITQIGNIVKEYLGIRKLTQITSDNYQQAKDISIALANTLCEFEWQHLKDLQKLWAKY